jgi:ligand-binding sensor domain-containing protein
VWDLHWDGERLWLGTGNGAEIRDLDGGLLDRYTPESTGLLHGDVHAVRVSGETVWFAMLGDHIQETDDFEGGGVTRFNRRTGEWRSWSVGDGLVRSYSCDLAVGENEVWVAHWHEESGLSVLDRRTGKWMEVVRSDNGIELGGVHLALDGKTLWIGQQKGLVRYETDTRAATHYTEDEGFPGRIVGGIAVSGGAVWVGAYSRDTDGVRSSGVARFARR